MSAENLSLIGIFLEGLLSFLSPCVLPLIPLYIGYLGTQMDETTGESRKRSRMATFLHTVFFCLGISTVFFLMGLGSGALREVLQVYSFQLQVVGGVLLILFGLVALHVIRIPFLEQDHRLNMNKKSRFSLLNAWLMGFFFSFAWTPCIGPLLASALVLATTAATAAQGFACIAAYTLGFILMFLVLGLFTEEVLSFIKKKRNILRYTQIIGGVLVLAMGVWMLFSAKATPVSTSVEEAQSTAETVDGTENQPEEKDAVQYNFTLKDSEGNEVSLTDFEGKTVVIQFFGTWCGYCVQEMPHLQEIEETRDDVKILMIAAPGLNGEGDENYIMQYMQDNGYTMQVLFDTDYAVTQMYGIQGYPTSFFVKPDQNFLGYMPGYVEPERMDEILDQAKE